MKLISFEWINISQCTQTHCWFIWSENKIVKGRKKFNVWKTQQDTFTLTFFGGIFGLVVSCLLSSNSSYQEHKLLLILWWLERNCFSSSLFIPRARLVRLVEIRHNFKRFFPWSKLADAGYSFTLISQLEKRQSRKTKSRESRRSETRTRDLNTDFSTPQHWFCPISSYF